MSFFAKYSAIAGSGGGVVTLNGLEGELTLVAGDNITITPDEETGSIEISAQDDIGANQELSNLNSTSINQDLIPAASSSYNIGSNDNVWNHLHVIGIKVDDNLIIDVSNSELRRPGEDTVSLNWSLSTLKDSSEVTSINYNSRVLYDSSEVESIEFDSRTIFDSAGTVVINYESKNINDSDGNLSIDWNSRALIFEGNSTINWSGRLLQGSTENSLDWENRVLIDASSVIAQDWENRVLNDSSGDPIIDFATPLNVTITANILPDQASAREIGAPGLEYSAIYADIIFGIGGCGTASIDLSNGLCIDINGVTAVDYVGRRLVDGNDDPIINWSTPTQLEIEEDVKLVVPITITPGGTTGNQVINKLSGVVNFAAAATTLTVTNNLVVANSIVFAVVRTNDATATIKNVIVSDGSFVINLGAAATAETAVGFFVLNPA